MGYLVAAFPALSVINHMFAVIERNGAYQRILEAGINPVRWSEYSLSAGIMMWTIGQLSSITDIKLLTSISIGNVAMQYCGFVVEEAIAKDYPDMAQHVEVIGFVVYASIWAPIIHSFVLAAESSGGNIPPAVYATIVIIVVLTSCFGALSIMHLRSLMGRPKKGDSTPSWLGNDHPAFSVSGFESVEKGYLMLSLAAKTSLTYLTLFGALLST